MKIVQIDQKKEFEVSSEHESEPMGIDSAALAHVMTVLTSLYSRPAWAVLREVVSNALDAHAEAGVKVPVSVTLPDYNNPTLVVKDCGKGMTKQQISKIYKLYGASTKRNDNGTRGGFGLGCKSPLAIADRFEVSSVAAVEIDDEGNPTKKMLTSFFVEKDATGIGRIYYTAHEETSLPTGVEVRVPYPANYISEISSAYADVPGFFLGVDADAIEFDGLETENNIHNEELYSSLGTIQGLDVWISKGRGDASAHALIGGIRYKMDIQQVRDNPAYSTVAGLTKGIYFSLPIGSVDLTPNREELIYSERTIEVINTILTEFSTLLERIVRSRLNKAETETEATAIWLEFSAWGLNLEQYDNLLWRGQEVEIDLILKHKAEVMDAPSFYGRRKASELSTWKEGYTLRRAAQLKVVDDGTTKLPNEIAVVKADLAFDARANLRSMKAVQEGLGIRKIYILSEEDYNNPWFAFTHHEKYSTAGEIIADAKEWRKTETAKARAEGNATRQKRGIAFVWKLDKKDEEINRYPYSVERIHEGDESFEAFTSKDFYYFYEGDHSAFPHFEQTLTTGDSIFTSASLNYYGLEQYTLLLAKKQPIVLLSKRQNVDNFLARYPKAKNFITAIKEYATKQFVADLDFQYEDVTRSLGYHYTDRFNRLEGIYKVLEEKDELNRITSAKFHSLKQITELKNSKGVVRNEEAEQEYKNLKYWSGYNPKEDQNRAQRILNEVEKIYDLIEPFALISAMAFQYETNGDHFIDYINHAESFVPVKIKRS